MMQPGEFFPGPDDCKGDGFGCTAKGPHTEVCRRVWRSVARSMGYFGGRG